MFIKFIRKVFPAILLAIDTASLYLIYFVVTYLRTGASESFFSSDQILFSMITCNALALYLIGAYEYQKIERSARFISDHIIASVIGATLSLFIILIFCSRLRPSIIDDTKSLTVFLSINITNSTKCGYSSHETNAFR